MLKALLDSLDGVQKEVASLYAPGQGALQGKFVLQVEPVGGYSLDATEGLKSELQRERIKTKELGESLGRFKDIDPTAAREALEKVKTIDSWNPDEKNKEWKARTEKQLSDSYNSQLKQLTDKHEKEQSELTKDNTTLTKQLNDLLVTESAMKALVESKAKSPALLIPHIVAQTRVEKTEDGRRQVVVVDSEGITRLSMTPGSKNAPMSIKELVGEMKSKDVYAPAFEGTGSTGPGAPRTGGSGSLKVGGVDVSKLPPTEKLKLLRRQESANAQS